MNPTAINRRTFLARSGLSLGTMALASLLEADGARANAPDDQLQWRGILRQPHHPPKAKRIIWLYMAGGPSHLETLDPKPELMRQSGQPMPESLTRGQPI